MASNEENKCIFCKIAAKEPIDGKLTDIVHEDEKYVAFRDIRPATKYHFLIIPKRHVGNPKSLTADELELIVELQNIGKSVLEKQNIDLGEDTTLYGYHWPPFNSIEHLHLHAIGETDNMRLVSKGIYYKNSPWFATHQWLVNHLTKMKNQ